MVTSTPAERVPVTGSVRRGEVAVPGSVGTLQQLPWSGGCIVHFCQGMRTRVILCRVASIDRRRGGACIDRFARFAAERRAGGFGDAACRAIAAVGHDRCDSGRR